MDGTQLHDSSKPTNLHLLVRFLAYIQCQHRAIHMDTLDTLSNISMYISLHNFFIIPQLVRIFLHFTRTFNLYNKITRTT